jgi:hypothetical protein
MYQGKSISIWPKQKKVVFTPEDIINDEKDE